MAVTDTIVMDRSATLQQGTREFAGIYERNAYLVYNLAFRITVDRKAAIEAASSAFLASLASSEPDAELPMVTVRRALMLAKQTATPEAAGDAEAQQILSRTQRLSATERAVLAFATLTSADAVAVASAIETTEEAAANLVERAWSSFARACELPLDPAMEAYQRWLWAEPPPELWALLYPSFYEHLVRRVNANQDGQPDGSAAATAVLAAVAPRPSRSERRRARRAEKDAQRAKPPGRLRRAVRAMPLRWAVVAGAILASGAGAAYAAGLIGGTSGQPPAVSNYSPAQPTQLSPAQLARLRAQEQQASLAYGRQQRLSLRQLGAQAGIAKAAWLRQRAAQLAAAKRQQAAALRARQLAARQHSVQTVPVPVPTPATPAPRPSAPASTPAPSSNQGSNPGGGGSSGSGSTNGGSGSGSASGSGSGNPTPGQVQKQCLYNADNGTWVCPQGQ